MPGFILEYGTENGEHVTVHPGAGPVEFYPKDVLEPIHFKTLDEFNEAHPAIIAEMVKNRVIRQRN